MSPSWVNMYAHPWNRCYSAAPCPLHGPTCTRTYAAQDLPSLQQCCTMSPPQANRYTQDLPTMLLWCAMSPAQFNMYVHPYSKCYGVAPCPLQRQTYTHTRLRSPLGATVLRHVCSTGQHVRTPCYQCYGASPCPLDGPTCTHVRAVLDDLPSMDLFLVLGYWAMSPPQANMYQHPCLLVLRHWTMSPPHANMYIPPCNQCYGIAPYRSTGQHVSTLVQPRISSRSYGAAPPMLPISPWCYGVAPCPLHWITCTRTCAVGVEALIAPVTTQPPNLH